MSSENNKNELEIKQELLKNEIIGKSLNPEKFLQFCQSQKENGDDLNNWTYEELKQCVQNFAKSQEQEEEEEKSENNTKDEKRNSVPLPKFSKSKTVNVENKTDLEDYEKKISEERHSINNIDIELLKSKTLMKSKNLEQEIKNMQGGLGIEKNFEIKELTCKVTEKGLLNGKNIEVTIKNPQLSDKSIFNSKFISYEITTQPLYWSVQRRYSDFEKFRNILCKYYPRFLIPPIPEKKISPKRFTQEFIEKRMKLLQLFIDKIIQDENFINSDSLSVFLNVSDKNQFERRFKDLINNNISTNFDDTKTLSGKVNLINEDVKCENYFSNIETYCKSQKNYLTKLSLALKNFCRNTNAACSDLDDIYKTFSDMHKLSEKAELNEKITKTYKTLSKFFKEWKNILDKENEIIHEKIKGFFKLQRLENDAYIELVDSREILKNKYLTDSSKLLAKKEKLYSNKDVNKWEIGDSKNVDKPLLFRDKAYAFEHMCSKDTQSVENLFKNLIYANYMNIKELKKIVDKNIITFADNMKEFYKEMNPLLNQRIELYSKLNKCI